MSSEPVALDNTKPTLVFIVGPIAGGKSTVARALTQSLRDSGERVALVELDQIAEMALPTLPDWAFAHSIFGSVVGQWLETPLDFVIAEGSGSKSEAEAVLARIPPKTPVVTIVITSTFEVAHSRALRDPTRGVSQNHQFLFDEYTRWARDIGHIRNDILVDTDSSDVADSVSAIRALLHSALDKP